MGLTGQIAECLYNLMLIAPRGHSPLPNGYEVESCVACMDGFI